MDSTDGRWDKVAVRRSQKAGILMEMGQDGQAREELEKAYEECLEVCTDTGNKYIESRVRKDLWQMYRDTQKGKGLLHLERYVDLQNELNSDRTAELMRYIRKVFDDQK